MFPRSFLKVANSRNGNFVTVNNVNVKVMVTVMVEVKADQSAGLKTCHLCQKEAGFIDLVDAVNWKLGCNLKTFVASLLVIWISIPCLCELFKGSSAPHPGYGHLGCLCGWLLKWTFKAHCSRVGVTGEGLCNEHNLWLCA